MQLDKIMIFSLWSTRKENLVTTMVPEWECRKWHWSYPWPHWPSCLGHTSMQQQHDKAITILRWKQNESTICMRWSTTSTVCFTIAWITAKLYSTRSEPSLPIWSLDANEGMPLELSMAAVTPMSGSHQHAAAAQHKWWSITGSIEAINKS